jgi:hypothetical protein
MNIFSDFLVTDVIDYPEVKYVKLSVPSHITPGSYAVIDFSFNYAMASPEVFATLIKQPLAQVRLVSRGLTWSDVVLAWSGRAWACLGVVCVC